MSEQSLQTLILAAIAIVLLLQTIVVGWVAIFIYRAQKPLAALMVRTHGFLEIARRAVERVDRELEQIARIVDERAEQADTMTKELFERSRIRVRALDELISQFLRTMEDVAEAVENTVKRPLQEARALGAGFRAGIASLFSNRPKAKEQTSRTRSSN
jgi:signal transduction histidine kinase